MTGGGGHGLWAITSFFNPAGYTRRRENFRRFRENLGVPLVAVELAYGEDFELAEHDAEIVIRIRGGDVMWQKERLLNIALQAVPPSCRAIAWVDADVVFLRGGWAEAAVDLLDRSPLVQLFSRVHYMARDVPFEQFAPATAELCRTSVTAAARDAPDPAAMLDAASPVFVGAFGTGMAWAARRALLDEHGFYDRCIVGSGDRAMIAAAWGAFDHVVGRFAMGEPYARHFLGWARGFREAVAGRVGYLDADIVHLWHGSLTTRANAGRHRELARFRYDPAVDIALTDDGPWRWNSPKPDMHDYLRSYFASRQEDG